MTMSNNTVFVLGAGASKEINLPSGHELKEKIAQLLDMRFDSFGSRLEHGDQKIVSALELVVKHSNGHRGDINPYLHESWHIRDALPLAISIDNFIDAHRDNEKIALCGKLAIARAILQAEKNSLLYFKKVRTNSSINLTPLNKTWYLPFFQLLTENCVINDLEERFSSVTLIIFNYDRCVEHFMCFAIQNYYKISEAEAANIVKCLNIYHPYGKVGSLPWENHGRPVNFGAEPAPQSLVRLSQQIFTFTEGTAPESSKILEIRKKMNTADRLVFIGFAFHKLNMQLIKPIRNNASPNPQCYATTYNISESDKSVIGEQINGLYSPRLNTSMANLSCGAFFNEFWRSLSF